ncbi:MAG: type 1 glutamine amidotransferase [Candidatus Nanohaloarchaea archaeon]
MDAFWDGEPVPASEISITSEPSFSFPSRVSVLDATLDWPKYSNRFRSLIPDHEIHKVMNHEYPDDPDIVVISGSTSGIYEDEEWIDELVERTRDYIEDGVPVLGLCFGHQVIAKAMGAEVVQMDRYEIGYRPVRFGDDEIFSGLTSVEYPFNTHQDEVVDMPEELVPIAETDVSVQGLKHREKPVYGVQFHPELTPEIARKAIRTKDIEEDRKEKLLEEVNEANFHRAKRALRIVGNFAEISRDHV